MLATAPRTSVLASVAGHRAWLALPLLAATLTLASCEALNPPGATGPRGDESLYPVLFNEDSRRKESIAVALNRLATQAGGSDLTETQLQPVTGTILNISPKANGNLYLPKVGAATVMNEEETRESLRRFIREWQQLIGSDPAKLSLVEHSDQPDGTKLATYEQRPFRHPIRGNYGKLKIRFTADRRVLNLTSSCIPDTEQIQTALSGYSIRVRSSEAVQQVREKGLTYTDANGNSVELKIPATGDIKPRSLVTYIRPSIEKPDALEFHLAWEMELTNAPIKLAYIDAVTGKPIAVG